MTSEQVRSAVAAFYRDLWEKHDLARMPTLLAEDFVFRGSLGQEKRGHAGFAEYVALVHGALGDYRCDIEDMVVEGNRAFARMRFSGRHQGPLLDFAPTGETVWWTGAALFTLKDGLIAELWVLGDIEGLRRRLQAASRESA